MVIIGGIFNILITGIGGQGTVLMGNILREYGTKPPYIKNVVGMETRGVSQREGSVSASARYLVEGLYSLGEHYEVNELISPVIPTNDAHLVLGLEPLETIRNLKYISERTLVILNTHQHFPRNVILGSEKEKKYPSNAEILSILDQIARRVISLDFNELSETKFGNSIYANTIILGIAVREFREIFFKNLMIEVLKKAFKGSQKNLEAFELGYNLISD